MRSGHDGALSEDRRDAERMELKFWIITVFCLGVLAFAVIKSL